MKALSIGLLCIFIGGCTKSGTPLTPNNSKDNFELERLFTIEGCDVYRFLDSNNYVYFTNCKGSTQYTIHRDKHFRHVEVSTDVE